MEKVLAQHNKNPTLISLSTVIQHKKKSYYEMLHRFSTTLDITPWVVYFCELILEAQELTIREMEFLIDKMRFLNTYDSVMNERQKKVIYRILKEGLTGFKGGLSSHNYQTITQTSSATATRDLSDMVEKIFSIKRVSENTHVIF